MSRYSILEKEINKNIAIDEKSGVEIRGWSPNNVRRLIIGARKAIVQYYVTGGKYNRLVEIPDLIRGLDGDLQTLKTDPKKYTGLLKVLTAGRICSSIEEIVLCGNNYPPELMASDFNLNLLIGNGNAQEKLANRFVRLRHISQVSISVRDIYSLVMDSKKPNQLLLNILKDNGVQVEILCEPHKDDWWRGTYLRGKLYPMDREGESLDRYFSKLIEEMTLAERNKKLSDLDLKKNTELIQREYPAINALSSKILQVAEQANEVFLKAPVIDKLQWASFLSYDNMGKGIRRELFTDVLNGHRNMTSEVRSIETDKVVALLDKMQLDSTNIKEFMNYIYSYCLTHEAPKVRDTLDVANSLKAIKALLALIFTMQINIVYLALIKFYLKSGLNHVDHHASKLNEALAPDLLYTRTTVEYMNKILPEGDAKQCLDSVGATEVLAEEFKSVPLRMSIISKILDDLTQVVAPSSRRG